MSADVEVFDAVDTVDVVKCGALAEGNADDPLAIDAPAWAAREAAGAIVGGVWGALIRFCVWDTCVGRRVVRLSR